MARPTKYVPDVHDRFAASLAMDGLTDVEIAKKMGIAKSTLNLWKKEHPSFSDSLKENKQVADAKVKESLYRRALGYSVKEKKVIVEMDSEGNQKPARIETTEKQIAPDTTAQIFWLKNRDPKNWRDRQEVDVTTDGESLNKQEEVDLDCLTEEEQQALISISLKLEENSKK